MSRKIILLGVNASWSQSNPALYYLREIIRDLPCEVCIEEVTVKDPASSCLQRILAFQPDVIGVSAYVWNRKYLENLIPLVQLSLPRIKIIIGGPEAGSLLRELPENEGIKAVFGAGEAEFRHLAQNDFQVKDSPNAICHISLRDIPFPYRKDDLERLAGHLVYYECSRGCPFSCAYCLSANDFRMEYRFDPDDAADMRRLEAELDALVALRPRTVKFVDRSFNLNRRLAHRVWAYVAQADFGCDFHFEIYPELLDDIDLKVLAKIPAGRIRLETGVQSVYDRTLARIGRTADWSKIKPKLLRLRNETAVHIHSDLLIGLPGEGISEIAHSINEVMQTNPHELQLGTLKILPDTPMSNIAARLGYEWDKHPPYRVQRTDALNPEDIRYLEEIGQLINLYWNRKNHEEQMRELHKYFGACEIYSRIHQFHVQQGIAFWGVSAQVRKKVISQIVTGNSFT